MSAQPEEYRDYVREMRDFLAKNPPKGDVIASDHAEKLVKRLQQRDPDLLSGWLMVNAVALLSADIRRTWVNERRTKARTEMAKAMQRGDSGAMKRAAQTVFDTERFVVDNKNTWRILGDMTKKDHTFVAAKYDERSQEAHVRAAFHRALARRLTGNQKTSDVITVADYLEIWHKLVGK